MSPQECRTVMIEIAGLTADWDGGGAEPIDVKVLADAWVFLARPCGLSLPDRIVPSPDGDIIFAWIGVESIPGGDREYVIGQCSFDGSRDWRFHNLSGISDASTRAKEAAQREG